MLRMLQSKLAYKLYICFQMLVGTLWVVRYDRHDHNPTTLWSWRRKLHEALEELL